MILKYGHHSIPLFTIFFGKKGEDFINSSEGENAYTSESKEPHGDKIWDDPDFLGPKVKFKDGALFYWNITRDTKVRGPLKLVNVWGLKRLHPELGKMVVHI